MNHRTNIGLHSGFSIVELMVAIALGLLLVGGLVTLFTSNSRARDEVQRSEQQIENGRYALQLLSDDLKLAGYLAEFNPTQATFPAVLPDPCDTTLATAQSAFPMYVQGYDNGTNLSTGCGAALTDRVTAGAGPVPDVLVVRRASTCSAGAANCDPVIANAAYFQASLCNPPPGTVPAELQSANVSDYYRLDTNVGNLVLHKKDCATLADVHRYLTRVYFVANDDKPGDGIPTLKRWELGSANNPVPLVEGVENVQFEYGVQLSANGGITYCLDPGSAAPQCSNSNNPPLPTTGIANWSSVVSVKIYLLVRNLDRTPGYTDTKTYTLGTVQATTFGPFNDGFRRHVYQTTVRLNNPAGRKL